MCESLLLKQDIELIKKTFKILSINKRIKKEYDKEYLVKSIVSIYKNDYTLLSYLLTDEELDFLKSNINKKIIKDSFYLYDLEKILIFIKSSDDYYIVDEKFKSIFIQSLNYYYSNKENIELEKKIIYITNGLIRIRGAISRENLISILGLFYHEMNDKYFDAIVKSPLFMRFFSQKKFKNNNYYTFNELSRSDLDFINYQIDNLDIRYKLEDIIEVGKHYFIYSNKLFNKFIYNLNNAYLLKNLNRNEIILYSGENNYDLENYISDSDLLNLSDKSKDDFYDFFISLPSFYMTSESSLFLSQKEFIEFRNYVTDIFDFAIQYFKISERKNQVLTYIGEKLLEDKFNCTLDFINQFNISKKEIVFMNDLRNYYYDSFVFFKKTKTGLILIDSNNNLFSIKIPLESIYHNLEVSPFYANACLVNFNNRIVVFTFIKVKKLSKDEISKYKDVYLKRENVISYKL